METNEFIKRLKDDPELAQNLKEALGRNAGTEELSGILAGAGIDAATAEALLSEYQLKRGVSIGAQELDDGELEHVAGGASCVYDEWCDRSSSACLNQSNCNTIFYCTLDHKCDSYV